MNQGHHCENTTSCCWLATCTFTYLLCPRPERIFLQLRSSPFWEIHVDFLMASRNKHIVVNYSFHNPSVTLRDSAELICNTGRYASCRSLQYLEALHFTGVSVNVSHWERCTGFLESFVLLMGGHQFSPLIIFLPARRLHSRYAMQQDCASKCHSGCGVTKIVYEYQCWTSCIAQVSLLTNFAYLWN